MGVRKTDRPGAERRVWLLVVAGSLAAVALELVRERLLEATFFHFLLWNLVLAWVPALLALRLRSSSRESRRLGPLLPLGLLWLLFLPNAPYVVTDVIHLRSGDRVSMLYDVPMLGVFAGTGLLLGFLSLYLVQSVVRARFGDRRGWLLVAAVIPLTGIGVYLGRVLRWNSWDLLVRPEHRIAQLLPHVSLASVAHGLALSAVVALWLAVGYAFFYAAVGARTRPF
jgi:uncharacterized membrane protein